MRWIGRLLLIALLAPTILAAAMLAGVNTDGGRALLAKAIGAVSGGRVLVTGLSGAIPLAPRAERFELRDAGGAWLRVEGAAVDISLRALLRRHVHVTALAAERLAIERLPVGEGGGAGTLGLPVSLRVARLAIHELSWEAMIPEASALALDGWLAVGRQGSIEGLLQATAMRRGDRYQVALARRPGGHYFAAAVREGPGEGLIAGLAATAGVSLPVPPEGWRLAAEAEGPLDDLFVSASLVANPLQARLEGPLDLTRLSSTGLRLSADLSAGAIAAGGPVPWAGPPIGSGRVRLLAQVLGSFGAPQGIARIEADEPSVGEVRAKRLTVHLDVDARRLQVAATLAGFAAPGAWADRLAPWPVRLGGELAYADPARPLRLAIAHPLLNLTGVGRVADAAGRLVLSLPDLSAIFPSWSGHLLAQGAVVNGRDDPFVQADLDLTADGGIGRGRVAGRLEAHLAGDPGGTLKLSGDWAGQPVRVAFRGSQGADGILDLRVDDSHWASVRAAGHLRLLRGAGWPEGELRLRVGHLGDLAPIVAPLVGPEHEARLAGRLDADIALGPEGAAQVNADGAELVLPGATRIEALALRGHLTQMAEQPQGEVMLELRGVTASRFAGDLALSGNGVPEAFDLDATAQLTGPTGRLAFSAAARLDALARRLRLDRLEAEAQGESFRLRQPASLDFRDGVAVDRLRLAVGTGEIDLAGRLLPGLALDLAATDLPLDLARLAWPDLPLTGDLSGEGRLAGSLDSLTGHLQAEASGVHILGGAARAVPASRITLAARLAPGGNAIDAQGEIGSAAQLRVSGQIGGRLPSAPGELAMRIDGAGDLLLLDRWLAGAGRQSSGAVRLDAELTGTLAAPRLNGALRLDQAAFRDRTIGLSLTELSGRLVLAGDSLRIEGLSGRAGRGTLSLSGQVGLLRPGWPVDLRLVARDARPVQLDTLTLEGDADLTLSGAVREGLLAAGSAQFSQVEIRLPERIPPHVVTLDVRERGGPRRATGTGTAQRSGRIGLGLDVRLTAERAVYLRGRGVDAELGGEIRARGTLAEPDLTGGLSLRRGEYELVGQMLRFSRGRVSFDGAAGLDPTLDLEARVTARDGAAILGVEGTVSAPRIRLRGEPELPEDEVLSRLLFGTARGRLSTGQITRLALAASALAGVELRAPELLGRARTGLGLDRLAIDTDQRGEAGLEAGRQLSDRFYLGARQGAWVGETQGVVRVEVTPRVRLEADVGLIGGTRAGAAFEREY